MEPHRHRRSGHFAGSPIRTATCSRKLFPSRNTMKRASSACCRGTGPSLTWVTLDATVGGEGLDLRRGHGEDLAAGQPRTEPVVSPSVHRHADYGGQQPRQPGQRQPARFRRGGGPGIESRRVEPARPPCTAGGICSGCVAPFNPRLTSREEAPLPRPIACARWWVTTRRGAVSSRRRVSRVRRLSVSTIASRTPGSRRASDDSADVEGPSLSKVEQPAFRVVHASNHFFVAHASGVTGLG